MIETNRLRLTPITLANFDAILVNDSLRLANFLKAELASDWLAFDAAREAMPFAAQYLKDHPESAEWWFYFFIHRANNTLIGMGGFKGTPTQEGVVEIGYSIAPSFQQQGYATEATQGLLRFAFASPFVERVDAHTTPNRNNSTNVLQKLGFVFQKQIIDAEDGLIWHWSLAKADFLDYKLFVDV
jgi:RimJ/RimL family protein N-acetyltransferase